jgi:hypothetical protein
LADERKEKRKVGNIRKKEVRSGRNGEAIRMSNLCKEQKINAVVTEEMKGFEQERNPKEKKRNIVQISREGWNSWIWVTSA